MKELTTERLRMRMLRNTDLDDYAGFYEHERYARFVGGKKDRAKAWRSMAMLVGHWHLMGFGYWAVEELSTGDFAGCVGLWKSDGWPELELGYWVVPKHHGKGYASEACRRAREYAFREIGSETLVSYISPENEPSRKLAKRLGAVYDSTIELLDHGRHEVWRYSPNR